MNSRLFSGASLLMLTAFSTHAMALNMKEDGGAAVYSEPTASPDAASLTDPQQAKAFPIAQRSEIYVLGGSVRGFGMLAQYETAPKQVLVTRRTQGSDKEPYTPIALASRIGTITAPA